MSNKINIKYLLNGTIEAEKPKNYKNMTKKELQDWAQDQLEKCSDQELIEGTYHYLPEHIKKIGSKYDSPPVPECIEDTNMDEPMATETWNAFITGGSYKYTGSRKNKL